MQMSSLEVPLIESGFQDGISVFCTLAYPLFRLPLLQGATLSHRTLAVYGNLLLYLPHYFAVLMIKNR